MEQHEKAHNLQTGRLGEDLATQFLEKQGYEIVAKNYVAGRVEIDLICRKNKLWVFVEVKARFNAIIQPEMAVDFAKQRNMARAASTFLHRNQIVDPIRFDVIAINFFQGKVDIAHFEDAFYPVSINSFPQVKIEEQLQAEHSKRNVQYIAAYIGSNQTRLKELFQVFDKGDYQITQRAAWVLSYVADLNPQVLQPHVPYMVQLLDKPFHVAIKRNVLRVLQDIAIPEAEMGILADKCFQYLHGINETGAVKAFAMTVLYKICLAEPELKHELILTLEDMIPLGSPAVRSRGTKVIKLLQKL